MQKGFSVLYLLLGIVIAAALISGGYFFGKGSVPVAPTNNPSYSQPTSQVASSPKVMTQGQVDETANWKTYTNTQAGFSFKYPAQYQLFNNTNGTVGIGSHDLSNWINVSTQVLPNTKRLTPSQYIDQEETQGCKSELKAQLKVTTLEVDKHSAARYEGSCQEAIGAMPGTSVLIDNKLGSIIALRGELPGPETEKLLNQILATFKFL